MKKTKKWFNLIPKVDTSNMSTEEYIKQLKMDKILYDEFSTLLFLLDNFKNAKEEFLNDDVSVLKHPRIHDSIDVLLLPEKIYCFLKSYKVETICDIFVYGEYLKFDRMLSEEDFDLIVEAVSALGIETELLIDWTETAMQHLIE